MEGGSWMKCFVFVVVLGVLATVQAQVNNEATLFPTPNFVNPVVPGLSLVDRIGCPAKCAFNCLKKRGLFGKVCLGLCMVKCQISPMDTAYGCTNNCVQNTISRGVKNVEIFVDSCYKMCSKGT